MPSATVAAYQPFIPPHHRESWDPPRCATAWIHSKLAVMKGEKESSRETKANVKALYAAAKRENDHEAARTLVDLLWRPEAEERIADAIIAGGVKPIIAFPNPGFDDDEQIDWDAGNRTGSRNAIPYAIAERLRASLGGFGNETVLQSARVGRTKLGRFPRFVFQPSFTGEVDPTRPYVLVDDTFTLGGTLAVMRSYIVGRGGTVLGVTALAHKIGRDLPFALRPDTRNSLSALYGSELNALWEGKIGHEPARLSDAEGRFLLEWGEDRSERGSALLHRLGTRLDQARTDCR
jgi:hypothetical protein